MKNSLLKGIQKLNSFADRWWYSPLVAFLAAMDAYVMFIPNEALLLPAILVKPKRWAWTALLVTFGSAIGATSFAWLASILGDAFVLKLAPGIFESKTWTD